MKERCRLIEMYYYCWLMSIKIFRTFVDITEKLKTKSGPAKKKQQTNKLLRTKKIVTKKVV